MHSSQLEEASDLTKSVRHSSYSERFVEIQKMAMIANIAEARVGATRRETNIAASATFKLPPKSCPAVTSLHSPKRPKPKKISSESISGLADLDKARVRTGYRGDCRFVRNYCARRLAHRLLCSSPAFACSTYRCTTAGDVQPPACIIASTSNPDTNIS